MASLLDIAMARQNPMMAGLLGIGGADQPQGGGGTPVPVNQGLVPSAAPTAEEPAGAARPEAGASFEMTPEDAERIRRHGMLVAGLNILADPRGGLPAIAKGVAAGMSAAERSKVVAEKRAKEVRRAELLSGLDLTNPEEQALAIRDALAEGDVDTAQVIAGFTISSPKPVELKTVDTGSEIEMYNPVTGDTVRVLTKDDERNGFVQADAGDRILLLDKSTGETVRVIPKALDTSGGEDKIFDRADKLADDYRSEISEFRGVANSIAVGLRTEPNAAGDLTLLSSLLRAQDPGATVRQSDIENGKQIGGIPARYQEFINRFAAEGKMPDNVRAIVREELIRLGSERRAGLQPIMQRYTDRALAAGVNPQFVAFDPYSDIGIPLPGSAGDPLDELGGLGGGN